MKLNIKNFAKIKEADIVIDGITVIAGENNTGKSTIGKVLFSLFNALSDIDEKISDERLKEIEVTNQRIIWSYVSSVGVSRSSAWRAAINCAKSIKDQIQNRWNEKEIDLQEIIRQILARLNGELKIPTDFDWTELIGEVYENTKEVLNLSEDVIIREFISRYFNQVFHSQIQSVSDKINSDASLILDIKGKKEWIQFEKNYCKKFMGELDIVHKAIYIDNPFVIDELSKFNDLDVMNETLKNLLYRSYNESNMDGIIESVRVKEKLADIFEMLQQVVDGEILLDQNEEFYLKGNNDEIISVHNLSTGMKSFIILKMLLEKGCLKNKDVVVLDEPEIHLHPQWQIAYAELIVLLQKQFDLSVVVTTHSPYFVDAINLFSCKYETDSKVNFYLSILEEEAAVMENVTDNIDLIYKKMASPIQMLDTLRYELNNH
ncbi:AAA family ATPase [Dorea amylophila]|uniref:AAA family ATPase n=1 Tax=Dorea amylophila TaxID=2981789 RepID=UPI0022DFE6C7|nr:AAA family ATPase [Dorea amylophila]